MVYRQQDTQQDMQQDTDVARRWSEIERRARSAGSYDGYDGAETEYVEDGVEESVSTATEPRVHRDTARKRRHKIHDEVLQSISDETVPESEVLPHIYTFVRERITPERAAYLIDLSESSFRNRNIIESHLERLVKQMNEDRFYDVGDPVRMTGTGPDDPGVCTDGQHRLWAIVLTGKPQVLVMQYQSDPKMFAYHDQGERRKLSQVLGMLGYKEPFHLASVVRKAFLLETQGDVDKPFERNPTIDELLDFLDDHPELQDVMVDTALMQRGTGVRTGSMGACVWKFRQIHDEDAEYFITKVTNGDNLSTDDPIYKFRERLRNHKLHSNKRLDDRELAALMIIAWNAFRNGRRIKALGWRPGGSNPQPFPTAQ